MKKLLLIATLLVVQVHVYAQLLPGELSSRGGLPNAGKQLTTTTKDSFTVAFLGGSITEAKNGWRDGTVQWLKQQYAGRPIRSINAAIGGTGSSLGVYRLQEHVLQHQPHLLFVEFAVNDGKASRESILESIEGIVRQTWVANPQTDICFVYTFAGDMVAVYSKSELPQSAKVMEELATHYNIPSVNLGLRVMQQLDQQKMFISGSAPVKGDSLFFSPDGVHPYSETGYRLYNQTVQAALPRLFAAGKKGKHVLKQPLFSAALQHAGMVLLTPAMMSGPVYPNTYGLDSVSAKFSHYFPAVLHLTDTAQQIAYAFEGTGIGFYDIIGPSSGNLKVVIDGGPPRIISRFDRFCTWYRPHWFVINDLPEGRHHIVLSLAPEKMDKAAILQTSLDKLAHPGDYEKQEWRGGKILVRNIPKQSTNGKRKIR